MLSRSNPRHDDVPLNESPFPFSKELGYYDTISSGVSQKGREIMWLISFTVSFVVTVLIMIVFISIMIRPHVRKKPYNIFLLFLLIPDMIFTGLCIFVCLANYIVQDFISVGICKFQSFFLTFGAASNCGVNAIISLELYHLLRYSYECKRYNPPSPIVVIKRCFIIYLWSVIIALVASLNFDHSKVPLQTSIQLGGESCFPSPYDTKSALFYYLVFVPITVGIPMAIVMFVIIDVLRKGYLPSSKTDHKRVLAMYFFRIAIVFVIFWTPALILIQIAAGWYSPWVQYVAGMWAHFQGAVSALSMLAKDDIRESFVRFVSCGTGQCCCRIYHQESVNDKKNKNICMDDFGSGGGDQKSSQSRLLPNQSKTVVGLSLTGPHQDDDVVVVKNFVGNDVVDSTIIKPYQKELSFKSIEDRCCKKDVVVINVADNTLIEQYENEFSSSEEQLSNDEESQRVFIVC